MQSINYIQYLKNNLNFFKPKKDKNNSNLTLVRNHRSGSVSLVGAGPGDPELLTRKAWRLINECDVLVYDALISEEVLEGLPKSIERYYVGKRVGQHSMKQIEICTLIVQLALQGKNVCRLKGGDPLVFGRLGEELDALEKENISYEVVPGITAASGCAASLGISLTERGLATRLRLITATFSIPTEINWSELASTDDTLVFYMGVGKASIISSQLRAAGLPDDYPTLIVENGTHKEQRAFGIKLIDLDETIKAENIKAPALIYVGKVTERYRKNSPMNSIATMAN